MVDHTNADTCQDALRIGIIGLGSRGLSVLERLLCLTERMKDINVQIVIFEPNEPGAGLHDCRQPNYLFLNTIACQLSVFPDNAAINSTDVREGPCLFTWCVEHNVQIDNDGLPCQTGGRPVQSTDFLSRRLLGEYLAWVYKKITLDIPDNVEIVFHPESVVRIAPMLDEEKYLLCSDCDTEEIVDKLFITIGHGEQKVVRNIGHPSLKEFYAYPIPNSLEGISSEMSIAIEGFGLSAMDTIAALTVGRGGKFRRSNDSLTYVASGKEPEIMLYSGSGLPFRVRPEGLNSREKHQALFLTPNTIEKMRLRQVDKKIDFISSVLPLIESEMRAAFYLTCSDTKRIGTRDANRFALSCEMRHAFSAGNLNELFEKLAFKYGDFSPKDHLLTSVPNGLTGNDYKKWAKVFIENDLNEGIKGLCASPLKSALEVWRDLRDTIRSIVNYGGLTDDSHSIFFTTYARLVNRIVAGPQKERHQELLTLIEAGFVTIAPGVNPKINWLVDAAQFKLSFNNNIEQTVFLDAIVHARVQNSLLLDNNTSLLSDLYKAGLIVPIDPVPGINGVKVNASSHPVGVNANINQDIWILGPLVEGSTYYNHYVPSSGSYSKAMADAHHAALSCLSSNRLVEDTGLKVLA